MSYKSKFLFAFIVIFGLCCCTYGEEYKPTVLEDTSSHTYLSYVNEIEGYTANIYFNKLYLDARVEIIAIDRTLTNDDIARIEYYQCRVLTKYFHLYGFKVCDRKTFYVGSKLNKNTFHIYFRQ